MIRVLIVDDSSFMRKALTHLVQSDPALTVAGTAADGVEAVRQVKELRPDVVLLDLEMPVMDGLEALAHIMAEQPTPVLVLSGLDRKHATVAIEALEHGAVDFIAKPSGVISYDIDVLREELIAQLKRTAAVDVQKLALRLPQVSYRLSPPRGRLREPIVVLGASTGGPRALITVLSGLPRGSNAVFLVVQHMGPEFVPSFAERLRWQCALSVDVARQGDVLLPGRIYLAPGDCHVRVTERDGDRRFELEEAVAQVGLSSIDEAMTSTARVYGPGCIGVLLSGMGSDGVRGLQAIKSAGGVTIVEDASTCVVFGMPRAAIDAGCADHVVPLPLIAQTILEQL